VPASLPYDPVLLTAIVAAVATSSTASAGARCVRELAIPP
jgi:hypothetical protein